jgi:FHA domain
MPGPINAMLMSTAMTTGRPAEWAIDDEVIRLREWATDTVHPLIWDARSPPTIGTAETCSIRVRAPSHRVARVHARFDRSRGRWSIVARDSEHGLLVDGAKRESAELRPGLEISLGGAITLVAESLQLIAVREELSRLLGWSPARRETVDLALRQVREHDLRRQPLILCGGRNERDLVPVAEELHRLTLTEDRPFILYDPHQSTTRTAEDPVRTIADRMTALAEAKDGTLCLLHSKLKYRELTAIYAAVLPRDCLTHIVLCTSSNKAEKVSRPPIVIPPLDTRKTELDRLISEYVVEAAKRLYCTKQVRLSPEDRGWLRTHACESLPEIQTATLRLVAVREAGNVSAGSALLGISHVALTKWLDRRGFAKLEAARTRKPKRARATTRAPARR